MVVVSSNFSPPDEGVLLQSPSTKLLINDQDIGTATLYITENNVIWGGGVRPQGGPAPSINLLYPSISLHAVQRDPSPALYLVLNYELRLPELNQPQQQANDDEDDDDDDFDADDHPITQIRFVPPNESELQAMYSAMVHGQALHPDPADELDDDHYMDGEEFDEGEGSEEFEDAEESAPDDAAARLRALRLDRNGHAHDGEDAEIGEE